MCTPDLRGTQGSFSVFTEAPDSAAREGGACYPLKRDGGVARRESSKGRRTNSHEAGGSLRDSVPRARAWPGDRARNRWPAVPTLRAANTRRGCGCAFRAAPGVAHSGHRALAGARRRNRNSRSTRPRADRSRGPRDAISHPPYYAAYLARLLGSFATLGMAEDTWALNEGAIDEAAFLDQALADARRTRGDVRKCARAHAARRGGVRLRYQRSRAAYVLPAPGWRGRSALE